MDQVARSRTGRSAEQRASLRGQRQVHTAPVARIGPPLDEPGSREPGDDRGDGALIGGRACGEVVDGLGVGLGELFQDEKLRSRDSRVAPGALRRKPQALDDAPDAVEDGANVRGRGRARAGGRAGAANGRGRGFQWAPIHLFDDIGMVERVQVRAGTEEEGGGSLTQPARRSAAGREAGASARGSMPSATIATAARDLLAVLSNQARDPFARQIEALSSASRPAADFAGRRSLAERGSKRAAEGIAGHNNTNYWRRRLSARRWRTARTRIIRAQAVCCARSAQLDGERELRDPHSARSARNRSAPRGVSRRADTQCRAARRVLQSSLKR